VNIETSDSIPVPAGHWDEHDAADLFITKPVSGALSLPELPQLRFCNCTEAFMIE
jgi:hypothetical protein